jgi:transcriptional regulator with PAS, ATPase and Fis domain
MRSLGLATAELTAIRNPMMRKLIEVATRIARSNSTVLLRGASGTGKEIFARAIHQWSGRSGHFIPINCGAIPEALLESEFFGYDAGAFTGAKREGKPGKFELADGGTIFLDELGTMPLHLQSKLLRVLEERRVDRLGGKQSFPVNVRIISATNENLEERVKDGRFREDLYFRLNVIPLAIPPLRERPEDIEMLGIHYLNRYCKILGKNISKIADDLLEWMTSYAWPGNIRELSNIIEYAVNVEDSELLTISSLPPRFFPGSKLRQQMSQRDREQAFRQLHGLLAVVRQHGGDALGRPFQEGPQT